MCVFVRLELGIKLFHKTSENMRFIYNTFVIVHYYLFTVNTVLLRSEVLNFFYFSTNFLKIIHRPLKKTELLGRIGARISP